MRLATRLIALSLAAFCLASTQALADRVLGSGSTFVYPVMAAWAEAYQKQEAVELTYQAIGSSGGVRELRAGVELQADQCHARLGGFLQAVAVRVAPDAAGHLRERRLHAGGRDGTTVPFGWSGRSWLRTLPG